MKHVVGLILAWILICGISSAVPTTGVATGITSNGFNTTVNGITGSDVWVAWGDYPDTENWNSPITSSSGGSAEVVVLGSPLYGGESVYFKACDQTGCGNEQHVTLLPVTPAPTTTYGQPYYNITKSRFDPLVIGRSLLSGYTTVTPATVLFGIMFMALMIGIWYRTKSVRLIAVLGVLISPFIMYSSNGLYLGIPSIGIGIAQGLLAAGLMGILFSFMRK